MYSTILCAAAGAAIFAIPAKADETVKWRHVHHYASNQSQQVPVNGHTVGVIRMPGIAFFPDGSIGTSLVIGTYDFAPGSGMVFCFSKSEDAQAFAERFWGERLGTGSRRCRTSAR
jgi:hypothetical protein